VPISEPDNTDPEKPRAMSYRLKLIVFLLAINIVALTAGYLCEDWLSIGLSR
jgi:hypothetical protein